ncbi:MAG: hypothetical protein ABW200_03475 [Hyphomicrobiaceae bacterium]
MAARLQHDAAILIDDGAGGSEHAHALKLDQDDRALDLPGYADRQLACEGAIVGADQNRLAFGKDLRAAHVGHALHRVEERHAAVQARHSARQGAADEELGVANSKFTCRHPQLSHLADASHW